MQTSQVSNPVNVLSAPAPANKQSESKAPAEPFGQVLSREVAGRNDAGKTREAGNANAGRQPTKNDAKPTEAKSAADAKSSEVPDTAEAIDASDEVAEVASQLPDDLLALVANLTQLNAPTVETAAPAAATASADTVAVTQDTPVATDATLVLAAGNAVKVTEPVAMPVTTPEQTADTGTQRKVGNALGALMDRPDAARQQRDPTATDKAELPESAASDLVAKGQELLNGTSSAATAPARRDFAAAVNESMTAVSNTMQPGQQVALQAVQTAAANTAEKLTPRVGTPAWDQALGQKVVWMVAGEQQSASLTLNPPDLGPLQVVLNVSNSQANATFIAAQPEVRQALEAALPKLREMLGEAGIQLGQASVNSGTPNQQGSFDQQASQSARHLHSGSDVPGSDAPIRVGRVQPASSGQGLIDTFV